MAITKGTKVSLEYTLKDESGTQIETNVGGEALEYVHGTGQIIAGLEQELEGLQVGDSKEVTVAPEEGYGVVDKEAIVEVPKDKVPEDAQKVGNPLHTVGSNGEEFHAVIKEIKEDCLVLDFNHALAGKTLFFTVKVLEVADSKGE